MTSMKGAYDSASVRDLFRKQFGREGRLFRAPSRVNIIGEHTDYNDGLVMPINLDLHTWLAIAPREDQTVRIRTTSYDNLITIKLDELRANPSGAWEEYPKGVMHELLAAGYRVGGADILIAGEIPLQSGLSSSASLETVVGLSLVATAEQEIDRVELAKLCQRAENNFVGVSCGIMDQFVVASCERAHAMLLDCRSLDTRLVPLPAEARFLIVHSGVQRQLREGGYNDRRQECQQLLKILSGCNPDISALRDIGPQELDEDRNRVGDLLFRRGRHVVTEIERVRTAYRALLQGDLELLGAAMSESHESLRNDFEVSCQAVDALVETARRCQGVLGSRLVGGGFGGCTITLVRQEDAEPATREIVTRYAKLQGYEPWHHLLGPTDAVCEVFDS